MTPLPGGMWQSLSKREIVRMRFLTIGALCVSIVLALSGSVLSSTNKQAFSLNQGEVRPARAPCSPLAPRLAS